MAVLRGLGKVAAWTVSAGLLARLGLPALGALIFLAVLGVWAACWVFCSDARTDRVSRVLLAWRGNASCLPPADAPEPALRQSRRWHWLRRS
jgi:hypothetical protein